MSDNVTPLHRSPPQTLAEITQTKKRPEAPSHLSDEAKEIWNSTTEALPVDFFREEALPILEKYCGHIARGRFLEKKIDDLYTLLEHEAAAFDTETIRDLDKLAKMCERETRASISCATKLRITQQATVSKYADKTVDKAKKPWEI